MNNSISINKYLDNLASRSPTPGGGSAAALAGCLGVSLLCMAANFSLGKRFRHTENKTKKILAELERARHNLKILIYLDMEAYNLVVLAKDLDTEIKIKAYEESARVSYAICQNCYKALKLTGELVDVSNYNLISDLEAGTNLLESAFNSANIFVEGNNDAIKTLRGKACSS